MVKVKYLDVACTRCNSLLTPTSDAYAICERCDGKLIPLTVTQMEDLEAAIEERRLDAKQLAELEAEAEMIRRRT